MFVLTFLSLLIVFEFAAIFFLWIEVKSMQKSTHSVQFIDPWKQAKQDFDKISEEEKAKLENIPLFDNL